jgi:hypothetical protein
MFPLIPYLLFLQIPVIMLVVEVPTDLITSTASNVQSPKEEPIHLTVEHDIQVQSNMVVLEDSISPKCTQLNCDSKRDVKSIRLDISFKSPSHTGLQTTQLVYFVKNVLLHKFKF